MRYIRRILVIPIWILFTSIFFVSIILIQFPNYFLSTDFYARQLNDREIYQFVMTNLSESVISNAREDIKNIYGPDSSNYFDHDQWVKLISSISTKDIVFSINTIAPQSWVQTQVEHLLDQFGGYLVGERDDFEMIFEVGTRADLFNTEIKGLLANSDMYDILVETFVTNIIGDTDTVTLLPGIHISGERFAKAIKLALTPEWLQFQLEYALDQITPYMTGKTDTFQINIQLSDRFEIMLSEYQELIQEDEFNSLLTKNVHELLNESFESHTPEMNGNLDTGPIIDILNSDQVFETVDVAIQSDWGQTHLEIFLDDFSEYLTGNSNRLDLEISLVEIKPLLYDSIAKLARSKLTEIIQTTPTCISTIDTFEALSDIGNATFPSCLPPNVLASELIDILDEVIVDQFMKIVINKLPDTIILEDFGGDILRESEEINQIRTILISGLVFTHEDLHKLINHKVENKAGDSYIAVQKLDNIRTILADDFSYTNKDYNSLIFKSDSMSFLANLDDSRKYLIAYRTYRFLLLLPAILILVVIGLIAARNWSSRIAWMAISLSTSSLFIFLISGPLYGLLTKNIFTNLQNYMMFYDANLSSNWQTTLELFTSKLLEVIELIVGDFFSSIADLGLVFGIIGVLIYLIVIFVPRISSAVRNR